MFRCVSDLKGLIIDADSFPDSMLSGFIPLTYKFKCLFIASEEKKVQKLKQTYKPEQILEMPIFKKYFSPSKVSHQSCLLKTRLKTTEIAYISMNKNFINNAMKFMSGTIWIYAEEPTFSEISTCPDIIVDNIDELIDSLNQSQFGLYGEVYFDPFRKDHAKGFFLTLKFMQEELNIDICVAGRYFSSSHYMYNLHPLSSALYLNKKKGKAFGIYNSIIENMFESMINSVKKQESINALCHVPTRPSIFNRFKDITKNLAHKCNLEDMSSCLRCNIDYPSQKNLSAQERYNNVKNVFDCTDELNGKNIALIDDIMTTGSTVRACVEKLLQAGVKKITVFLIAINQIDGSYWTLNLPIIQCPQCGENMALLANSNNRKLFYTCLEYKNHQQSYTYEIAHQILIEKINNEFPETIEERGDESDL